MTCNRVSRSENANSGNTSTSAVSLSKFEPNSNGTKEGVQEKLVVAVRIRPLASSDGERCLHCLNDKTIIVEESEREKEAALRHKRNGEKHFIFDHVFGEDATQEAVYEATTKPLVRDVLLGYNATVFAYGATGSGKTHTMVGHPGKDTGIMVRAMNQLFQFIEKRPQQYSVILSYLEIYNENIRDLLNPRSGYLELREDSTKDRSVHVAGLTEVEANSTEEVMGLLQKGNKERSCEPTAANKTSSRSHALLSVTVRRALAVVGESHNKLRTRVRQGRLFMIDLAGSERAAQTKNRGKRLQEGAHINRSLLALGNCINALSGGGGGGGRYVNYRDSKLTRLLREPLSGNCRTVMIAHVSPALSHREETRNTLVYAARASGITHKVEKNELDISFHVSQYRSMIADLRNEISRLRNKMEEKDACPQEHCSPNDKLEVNGCPQQAKRSGSSQSVKQLREQIVATFREQMKLRRRLMDIDGHLLSLGVEAERQHQIISQWESRNNKLYRRQSSHKWRNRPSTTSFNDVDDEMWNDHEELNMHQAWSELSYIEREQERYINIRSETVKELDAVRHRAVALENDLPKRLDSDTERELLSLLCRVHELEADKMALQGERLVESHELRRRGELLLRFHRQQRLTDDIITRQRQLIEDSRIGLPNDLHELYSLYQQEIHAATASSAYNVDTAGVPYSAYDALPPLNKEPVPVQSARNGERPSGASRAGRERQNGHATSNNGLPLLNEGRFMPVYRSSLEEDTPPDRSSPPIPTHMNEWQRERYLKQQHQQQQQYQQQQRQQHSQQGSRHPNGAQNGNSKDPLRPSPAPPSMLFPPISDHFTGH